MCLIQDVPTLGRHPVKRVHAAVPSAAEDDFPAFGTSQRVLAHDLPRTGCRSLWTRTMPLPCSGCAGETVRMRSLGIAYPSAALGPTCRSGRAQQERYVLMLMTKRLNGLSRFGKLSGIRDIPYPGRAASVRRGAGSGDGIRHLRHTAIPWRAGERSPGALACHGAPDSAGLAPDQRPRRASGHRPRFGLVMLAPVGEFFLVDFQVQLGNARLQPSCTSATARL